MLNVVTVVSLLLCLATAALWLRSGRRWDRLITYRICHGVGIGSAHGRIILNVRWTNVASIARDLPAAGWSATDPDALFGSDGSEWLVNDDPLSTRRLFDDLRAAATSKFGWEQIDLPPPPTCRDDGRGFPIESAPAGPRPVVGDRLTRAWLPHGLIVLLSAIPPTVSCVRLTASRTRWRRRRRRGLCPACGYDVRATPDRCPECGMDMRTVSPIY